MYCYSLPYIALIRVFCCTFINERQSSISQNFKITHMNRAMTKILTHTCMIIIKLKTLCDGNLIHHGELHLTTKIKIINR